MPADNILIWQKVAVVFYLLSLGVCVARVLTVEHTNYQRTGTWFSHWDWRGAVLTFVLSVTPLLNTAFALMALWEYFKEDQ